MSLSNIRIVLVHPLYGGNVGSVCRAMMNMGLSKLVLVGDGAPAREWDAGKMALSAKSILEARSEFPTLEDAVADCGVVAGTSARKGLYRSHAKTPREWAPFLLETAQATEVALVFGPEDRGLSNEELAACTQIIRIPSSPAYESLNLAQAVMVCAYELFQVAEQVEPPEEFSEIAPGQLRERMFDLWQEAMLDVGFMKSDKTEHMMMGIRRIFSRAPLTENDVKILMGMAGQSSWCARELARRGLDARDPASRPVVAEPDDPAGAGESE